MGGIDDGASDAGVFSSGVNLSHGIKRLVEKLDPTNGDEADGEAVHAIAYVAFCSVGSRHIAGEVIVGGAAGITSGHDEARIA